MKTLTLLNRHWPPGLTAAIDSLAGSKAISTGRTTPEAISAANSRPSAWARPRSARTAVRMDLFGIVGAEGALGLIGNRAGPPGEPPDARRALQCVHHAGVPFELGRHRGLAMRHQIGGGGDGDHRCLGDLPGDEAGIQQLAIVNADIDPLLDPVDEAVGDHQFDGHLGMAGEELTQPGHDIKTAEDGRYGGAHRTGGRDPTATDAGGFDIVHKAPTEF